MNNVGTNIRKFREAKGATQENMAEALNMTRQAVSNWECGKTEPDIDTLHRISQYLGVSIEELIYGEKRSTLHITKTIRISERGKSTTKQGVGFGVVLAAVISYVNWRSVGWAILHGFLNWVYVIYYVIKYGWN